MKRGTIAAMSVCAAMPRFKEGNSSIRWASRLAIRNVSSPDDSSCKPLVHYVVIKMEKR